MAERYPRVGEIWEGGKSIRLVGAIYAEGQIGFTYWSRKRGIYGPGNDCICSRKSGLNGPLPLLS